VSVVDQVNAHAVLRVTQEGNDDPLAHVRYEGIDRMKLHVLDSVSETVKLP